MSHQDLHLELMQSAERSAQQAVLMFDPPLTDEVVLRITQTFAQSLRDGFDECDLVPPPDLISEVARHFADRLWFFSDVAWKVQNSEVPS